MVHCQMMRPPGLDNAGKSTLVHKLCKNEVRAFVPTTKAQAQTFTLGQVQFTAWDLGGHEQVCPVLIFLMCSSKYLSVCLPLLLPHAVIALSPQFMLLRCVRTLFLEVLLSCTPTRPEGTPNHKSELAYLEN